MVSSSNTCATPVHEREEVYDRLYFGKGAVNLKKRAAVQEHVVGKAVLIVRRPDFAHSAARWFSRFRC